MRSPHLLLLNGILLALTLAHLARCAPPPTIQAVIQVPHTHNPPPKSDLIKLTHPPSALQLHAHATTTRVQTTCPPDIVLLLHLHPNGLQLLRGSPPHLPTKIPSRLRHGGRGGPGGLRASGRAPALREQLHVLWGPD